MKGPIRPFGARGENEEQGLLVGIVAFNALPHTLLVPHWVMVCAAGALIWKTLKLIGRVQNPSRWVSNGLAAVASAGVAFEYGTIFGLEPATSLLILLGSFKALDSRRHRDSMIVIFVSYFLLMTHLLASQTLASTAYMAIDVFLITTLTYHLHSRDRRGSARSFRPIMKLLAYAGPLMAFLFFAFPRFSAGLFPQIAQTGSKIGFSEELSPGAISRLIENDVPAFRATFLLGPGEKRPPIADMYWRGAVLEDSDGLRWSRDMSSKTAPPTNEVHPGPIAYEAVTEPGYQPFLFTLEPARSVDFTEPIRQRSLRLGPGHVFSLVREADARIRFRGTADIGEAAMPIPNGRPGRDSRNDVWLQSPETTPRVLELVRSLAEGAKDDNDKSERVLQYFARQGFRYTRTPGAMKTGSLDEFLFETKTGFCEHYAGAYSTIMRLMKVPARVIVGFQGGQPNEFGSYLLVRGLDAHAWSEIYRSDIDRWVRVDPTLSVAPMRQTLGGDFNLADPNWLSERLSPEDLQRRMGWLALNVRRSAMAWDAATTAWTNFLLRYDFDYQINLLNQLGLAVANRAIFFVWIAVVAACFAGALYGFLRWQSRKEDPALMAWRIFCRRLESLGLARAPNEGPLEFGQRAIGPASPLRPDVAARAIRITSEFAEIRYGDPSRADRSRVRAFIRDAKSFRSNASV